MKKTMITFVVCFATLILVSSCSKKTETDTFGDIAGTVIDNNSGLPIQGAVATLSPTSKNTYTASDGQFEFHNIDPMQYTVTVTKNGYRSNRKIVNVYAGETTTVDLVLYPEEQ